MIGSSLSGWRLAGNYRLSTPSLQEATNTSRNGMENQSDRITMPALRVRLGVSGDTIFRWTHQGLGGIVLKTAWRGGRRYSTSAWVEEFLNRVNEVKSNHHDPVNVGG
jgi:hypothetical protein